MGTEVEGTITWHIHPGVSFDIIGGVVFAGVCCCPEVRNRGCWSRKSHVARSAGALKQRSWTTSKMGGTLGLGCGDLECEFEAKHSRLNIQPAL